MATHCYTDKKHFDNGYNIFVPEIQQVTGHDQLFVTAFNINSVALTKIFSCLKYLSDSHHQ